MRRRAFITLLGGAVVWPVVTRAQQGERVRVIGILNILGKDDPEAKVRLIILQGALKQLGWEGGRDFKIESRQVGGDVDRLRDHRVTRIEWSTVMVTPYRPKPPRNRVAISTRELARRMRKRLNKTTEGMEVAVAKVKNNAEIATKELEAKRT